MPAESYVRRLQVVVMRMSTDQLSIDTTWLQCFMHQTNFVFHSKALPNLVRLPSISPSFLFYILYYVILISTSNADNVIVKAADAVSGASFRKSKKQNFFWRLALLYNFNCNG